MKIKCPVCKELFQDDDMVFLDPLNTIVHRHCYTTGKIYMKAYDSYRNIIDSYSFFSKK